MSTNPSNETMEIEEILRLSPEEAIKELSKKAIKITPWAEIEKEYDPRKHAVLDKAKYPDVPTESGRIEEVTRVVVPFQKLAVNRISELCFATPCRRTYQVDDDKQKEAVKVLERIVRKCRIDSLNRLRSKKYFASCEVATIWNAVQKDNLTYGFPSKLRLRQRTFSCFTQTQQTGLTPPSRRAPTGQQHGPPPDSSRGAFKPRF